MAEEQQSSAPKPKKPIWKKWWIWLITIFVLIIIIASGGDKSQEIGTPQVLEKPEEIVEIDTEQPIIQPNDEEQIKIEQEETSVLDTPYTPPTTSEKPTPAPEPQPQPEEQTQESTLVSEKWYTSSHHTAKYYYHESCQGWQGLSPTYLKVFDSEAELLSKYNRTLHPDCNPY